jgi:hypothetical protein
LRPKRLYLLLLFVSFFSISIFIGCSTDESNDADNTSADTTQTITNDDLITNSEIETSVDDISIIAEDQFSLQKSISTRMSSPPKSILPLCATITTSLIDDIYTKTIDFGDGCTLPNGNSVKGKIIISFSKIFSMPIKTITYTLVGFHHNGKLIEGNQTITYELKSTELLAAIHPVSTHSIDAKITFPDGKVYSRIGTTVREMTEGFDTLSNWEDNVFLVSGSNITTSPSGTKYTLTATTPLRVAMSCRMPFPVKGVIKIVKNGAEATLDYGNGDCDKLATVTMNGVTVQIELKK